MKQVTVSHRTRRFFQQFPGRQLAPRADCGELGSRAVGTHTPEDLLALSTSTQSHRPSKAQGVHGPVQGSQLFWSGLELLRARASRAHGFG